MSLYVGGMTTGSRSGRDKSSDLLKLIDRPPGSSNVLIPVRRELVVGVPLLLDIIDIAEPGRGVGLGLGGPSEPVSSEPEDAWWMMMGLGR